MKKLFAVLLMFALLFPAALAETTLYVAGGGKVHLRAAPDKNAKSLGLYYSGTPVTRLGAQTGWYQLRIGDQTGWMMADYIAQTPVEMVGPVKIVDNPNGAWVHLREGASTGSASLGQVYNTDQVSILGETADGWSYVNWRGHGGFMRTGFLKDKPVHSPNLPEKVGWGSGEYIYRLITETGQELFFTSVEEEPGILYKDVNFDGHEDIVVTTSRGATNFFVEFFVWDGVKYVMAEHRGAENLPNYSLYPEYGLVKTDGVNGGAGSLFEDCLFRWEGTDLKLVRRAVSKEKIDVEMVGENLVSTYTNTLHVRVLDYPDGPFAGVLMHEEYTSSPSNADKAQDFFGRMTEIFWKDIR